jgi:hypothetical protein
MTATQKDIIAKLISGHYIVISHGREILYRDNAVPVIRLKWYDSKKIRPLLKKDRKGRLTANLSTIRQLHGNSTAKRLYKGKLVMNVAKAIKKRKSSIVLPQGPTLF